jgi:hypothetical protein
VGVEKKRKAVGPSEGKTKGEWISTEVADIGPMREIPIDEAKQRQRRDMRVMREQPGETRTSQDAPQDIRHFPANGMLAINATKAALLVSFLERVFLFSSWFACVHQACLLAHRHLVVLPPAGKLLKRTMTEPVFHLKASISRGLASSSTLHFSSRRRRGQMVTIRARTKPKKLTNANHPSRLTRPESSS